MDEFLKIEVPDQKESKLQKEKRKDAVDKKRVARLKKNFLPYWAREMELESREENNVDLNH